MNKLLSRKPFAQNLVIGPAEDLPPRFRANPRGNARIPPGSARIRRTSAKIWSIFSGSWQFFQNLKLKFPDLNFNFSNALLMIALWRQRSRKLNTHTLVFWLAVNDMMVGIFVIPSTLPSLFTKRQVMNKLTFEFKKHSINDGRKILEMGIVAQFRYGFHFL